MHYKKIETRYPLYVIDVRYWMYRFAATFKSLKMAAMSVRKGAFGAFEMNGSVTEERVGDTTTGRPALCIPPSRRADALFVFLSFVSLS